MKKIIYSFLILLFAGGGSAYAQEMLDAYKSSQNELHGTARYASMAGAFGALGGDVSVMSTNPAGIGIYRTSEVVTTLSLSSIKAETNLSGSKLDQSKTKFNFDNIAYVGYIPTGNYSGVKGWNFGFAYNKLKNFSRNYTMNGASRSSISNYIAEITNDRASNDNAYTGDNLWLTDDYNPFDGRLNPLSIVGYSGGLIAAENEKLPGGFFNPFTGNVNANFEVVERGGIDQYDFVFATNISDIVFLGATFTLTDLDYTYTSLYKEKFPNAVSELYNDFNTEGNGYGFNIGAIVRPVDFLRLGVAYNSPTWYKLTDYSYVQAASKLDVEKEGIDVYNTIIPHDYKLRTNDRWIFSAAGFFGQYGLISIDYELTNYKNMSLSTPDGLKYDIENESINEAFGTSGILKVGAEYKVTPQFAVRAGGSWANSPIKSDFKNGLKEVYTAGTIPHYTIDKGVESYSIGFGYRFTPRFYADLACVYKIYKEDLYSFSNVFEPGTGKLLVQATPAEMKTKTTRVALTLGYKF